MMSQIHRVFAFVALVSAPLFLSTTTWGWFWEKTNTVKAYEQCMKENRSSIVDLDVIKRKCLEKHVAPIPLEKVIVNYGDHDRHDPGGHRLEGVDKNGQAILGEKVPAFRTRDYFISFSTENFLLTNVEAIVQVDGGTELKMSAKAEGPFDRLLLIKPVPTAYRSENIALPSYSLCKGTPSYGCISLRVLSARGLEIAIN